MLSAADARDGHPVCQYFIPDSDRDHGELSIQLYEQYPVLIGIVPVAAALFYAGILVTIISYQKMVGFRRKRGKGILWNSSRSMQYRSGWRRWISSMTASAG